MILAWWLYCVVVAALFGLAALAGEGAARAWNRPGRGVWVTAMVGTLFVPVLSWLGPFESVGGLGAIPGAAVFFASPLVIGPGVPQVPGIPEWAFVASWLAASSLLAGFAAVALIRLRGLRGGWTREEVDSVPVLVSGDVGPAAVGLARGDIVLPRWVLRLEHRLRRLILLHEREHLSAGDPRLILLAFAAVIAAPWNPVLWWQLRRLRLAVEVHCDRRVLRADPDLDAYGSVLLEVGRHRSAARFAMAAFVEPRSFLERRIRMMTRTEWKHRLPVGAAFAALAALLLAGACWAPEPTESEAEVDTPTSPAVAEGAVSPPVVISEEPTFTPYTVAPELANRDEVIAALESNYPALLRHAGIGGEALIWFYIDETGTVRRTQVEESSGHEALDEAAVRTARVFEFTPALNKDVPVPVWIALPIVFQTR